MYLTLDRGTFACLSRAVLLGCMFAGGFQAGAACAAEPAAKTGEPATRFASVGSIRGEVTATAGDNGPTRTLRQGDPVYVGERIHAAASSEAVLKTDDAGRIAIRPHAELVAELYAAEGKQTDHFTIRLIKGGMRMITGWIGRLNPAQYKVNTLTAVIGIRGTDHEPYVMSPDLAETLAQDEGTYDKVNRGGTIMDVNGKSLDIDPGKVGFARSRPTVTTRGLLTVLLPVLLDKVPAFYVPGQFDDELDRLSQTADEDAQRELDVRRKSLPAGASGAAAPVVPVPSAKPAAKAAAAPASPEPPSSKPALPATDNCAADTVARTWLSEFDGAISRRDAPAIVQKFAPEVSIRATVRGAGGEARTIAMGREEMAQSTIAALKGLTDYQQRRPSIEGRVLEGGATTCDRIGVRSVVIEQGRQNDRPYRFESVEEFVLERRGGLWLAIRAETTQR